MLAMGWVKTMRKTDLAIEEGADQDNKDDIQRAPKSMSRHPTLSHQEDDVNSGVGPLWSTLDT